jgi:hypothetical protein
MTTSSMSTSSTYDRTTTGPDEQGSTTEQAKHAASVAQDEMKSVASDVRDQARGLLDETKIQVQDQSRTQRDRLVRTLRTFSDDLDGMATERGGLASDAAREVAQRARAVSERLDGREPTELLEDLRSFARRRPGVFLAGAMISGVVVGRILRGSRDAAQGGTYGGSSSYDVATTQERPVSPSAYDPTTTATASPPAPTDQPVAPPASPAVTSSPETSPGIGRPVGGP